MKKWFVSLFLTLFDLSALAAMPSKILISCTLASQPKGLDYKMDFQLESLNSKRRVPDNLTVHYSSYWDRVEFEGDPFQSFPSYETAAAPWLFPTKQRRSSTVLPDLIPI